MSDDSTASTKRKVPARAGRPSVLILGATKSAGFPSGHTRTCRKRSRRCLRRHHNHIHLLGRLPRGPPVFTPLHADFATDSFPHRRIGTCWKGRTFPDELFLYWGGGTEGSNNRRRHLAPAVVRTGQALATSPAGYGALCPAR